MKINQIMRYLLLGGLALLLVGAPTAILAADQGASQTGDTSYLPLMMKAGAAEAAGTLSNGGTVEGPDGVGIGALDDTLEIPIQVSIVTTTNPTTTMPAPAKVLSDFYQIGAGENVIVSPESPFILAFPLPSGVNTANLALAMYQSGEEILDVEDAVEDWTYLEGMVDQDQGLFLTTIAALKQDGQVFALVEHPDLDSPPNDGSSSDDRMSNQNSAGLFNVQCLGFALPTSCTETTEAQVAAYLTDIYDRLHTNLGFIEPRLRFLNGSLGYSPHSLNVLGYSAYIQPEYSRFCKGNAGFYDPRSGRLVLCYNPAVGLTSFSLRVLIHEYFHATQYAHRPVLADYLDRSEAYWVIEGMAASTMESYFVDEMVRFNGYDGLHKADISLEYFGTHAELDEYQAQDFWVYYGRRNGLDLRYLASVLAEGSSSLAVANVLENDDYLDVYWDWVKNHVMEPSIDYDGMLGTPCQLETDVVFLLEEFNFNPLFKRDFSVTLQPLTSVVVKINWDKPYNVAAVNVGLEKGEPPEAELALRAKFYVEGEPNCQTVPDRFRNLPNIQPSTDYYVVVSNIDPVNTHTYRILILDWSPP